MTVLFQSQQEHFAAHRRALTHEGLALFVGGQTEDPLFAHRVAPVPIEVSRSAAKTSGFRCARSNYAS
jgi:hypothetical protein